MLTKVVGCAVEGEAPVEIFVLGPVCLGSRQRRIALRSDKERCVLASLALAVGRPVALDTLVGRLWDGDPPDRARQAVHTYVSRLRSDLRRAHASTGTHTDATTGTSAPAITHHAHTYTLDADPDRIDWHRFQRLATQARSLSHDGDDEAAAALLHEAERLWHGEALAGLPGSWSERTRTSLAEKRLGVASSRIAMELRLRRFSDLVGDLSSLAGQYPDDESLLGQLMVAYYGCGRHADALRVHEEARRRLRAELGAVPGEELTRIHRHILHRGPLEDLLPGAAADHGTPSAAPPRNLPRHIPLIGRHTEMRRLRAAVDAVMNSGAGSGMDSGGGGHIVALEAISGMAGVGKTAMAVSAAHLLGERFPDGQLYLDLRAHAQVQDPLSAGAALAVLLRLMGVPADGIPSDIEERTALWRTVLTRRRMVIVLDDAAGTAQVRPLLPGSSPSLVIITSRRRLSGLPGARTLALDVLPPDDAVALFREFAGADRTRESDVREIARIVGLCGYLPLAIEIVANRFSARPSWTLRILRDRLSRGPGRLGEFRDGNSEIARAFELSYQTLTVDQRSMFRRLGLHLGAEFGPHAAASLTGLPLDQAEWHLETLLHCHLLQEPAPNRYRFHDLLGEYARVLAFSEDSAEERDAALRRLIDFYLFAAVRADTLLYPRRFRLPVQEMADLALSPLPVWRSAEDAKDWLTTERSNLLTAERHARTHGAPDRAALLSHALAGFLDAECHWTDTVRMHRHAVDHWERADDRRALRLALLDLGATHANTSDYAQAAETGRRALALARAAGDTDTTAAALRALGVLHWHLGENDEALALYEETLEIQLASGNAWDLARTQNNIAISFLSLGDHHRARKYFHEAIENFQLSGDQRNLAKTLNNFGDLHTLLGEQRLARQTYEESLRIAKSSGSHSDQATIQANLAGFLAATGDVELALDMYQECLFIFRRLGDRKNEANSLIGLGRVHHLLGRPAEAATYHGKALELARNIGAAHEEVESLRRLGQAEADMQQLPDAAEHLEAAIAAARRMRSPEEEARAADTLAEVRVHEGRTESARALWQQAYDIFSSLDQSEAARISECLSNMPEPFSPGNENQAYSPGEIDGDLSEGS
ncbi:MULTISPECIES: AfsR/SARP family transcriptional regulator [Streptomyces]|uniref:AfsR/SARP family transcriptional regulator n=1 Tax=Streptomyces TaxID=1883 RepID=UPI000B9E52FF|nr:tetratricopeptide repeat protein [Streptomyces kasugaensis]